MILPAVLVQEELIRTASHVQLGMRWITLRGLVKAHVTGKMESFTMGLSVGTAQ